MFHPACTIVSRNATAASSIPKSASATAVTENRANRHARAVGRERREDRMQPRPVREARVDHRRRAIEAKPERRDHALRDAQDRFGVELAGDRFEPAGPLDEYPIRPVHHDLVDRRVREQRLQRPEPVDLGDELVEHAARRCVARERGRVAQEYRETSAQLRRRQMLRIERRGQQPPLQDVTQRPALENRLVGHAASSRPRQPMRRSTSRTGRASASGRPGRQHTGVDRARASTSGSRRSRGSGRRARSRRRGIRANARPLR